ncbi:hypothetical protein CMV_020490 [Castanea mollissima]|uniref:Uncharacterized protein n=1 Tax=Castanea mollissima TaxID=60419 RepID=A0A8J4QQL5_9ROSI|nr:hypothetical protein CMV_020490 [Castanea mollissima]
MGNAEDAEADNQKDFTQASMIVESVGGPQSDGDLARIEATTIGRKIPDFEACIREIDDALIADPKIMPSSSGDPKIHTGNIGRNLLLNGNTSLLLNSESVLQESRRDKDDHYVREGSSTPLESSFVVGRVDKVQDNVVGLHRPNRNKNKNDVLDDFSTEALQRKVMAGNKMTKEHKDLLCRTSNEKQFLQNLSQSQSYSQPLLLQNQLRQRTSLASKFGIFSTRTQCGLNDVV